MNLPLKYSKFPTITDKVGDFLVRDSIQAVWDGRARQKIVDRYLSGWIGAEMAMETLIGLDLVEYDPRLREESEMAE